MTPTPEDERLSRRVAALIERCYRVTNRQLIEVSKYDMATLEYAATLLRHVGWRGPRG